KVVIKTRQHLATIKPEQNALVLELMHFAEEMVESIALQIPGALELGARELQMATELIDRMSGHWNAEKYTDDYRHALMNLIQKKIELGDKGIAGAKPSKVSPTKVIDLVSVLQESLKQAGKSATSRKTAVPKRKAALKRAA